jgi:hypothetical protein
MGEKPVRGTVESTEWLGAGIVQFTISNDDGMFVETYTFEEIEKLD